MRWMLAMFGLVAISWQAPVAHAGEDKEKTQQVLGGVISGLLGGSSQSPDAVYTAKGREQLASFLQSGDYATTRQGESIDVVVLGIPLTRSNHVYTATPVTPASTQQPGSS